MSSKIWIGQFEETDRVVQEMQQTGFIPIEVARDWEMAQKESSKWTLNPSRSISFELV
jgi:hypothetical protein